MEIEMCVSLRCSISDQNYILIPHEGKYQKGLFRYWKVTIALSNMIHQESSHSQGDINTFLLEALRKHKN